MPRDASDPSRRSPGSYAFDGLQRIIHEKARLSIVSSLAANPEGLVFTELRSLCALTDGNLSRQIQILQSAGLVEVWKRVHKGRPQTLCRLTDIGREQFLLYVAELEKVVASAQQAEKSTPNTRRPSGFDRAIPSF